MKTIAIAAIAISMCSSTTVLAQDANPGLLLQQAIDLVETRGDWDSAVPLLEDAAESPDPVIAFQALLYLAQYRERSDPELARQAYERIAREFANQNDAVARAEARLAVLPARVDDTRTDLPGLAARNLWSAGGDAAMAISPDGRRVAFVDWSGKSPRPANTGDLGVADIRTGEYVIVGQTLTGLDEAGDTYVEGAIWSKDGERLAYTDWGSTWDHQILHVVNADGSGHRVVSDNPQHTVLRPKAWSSDGKWVVTLARGWDNVNRIALISTEDGTVTVLKTLRTGFSIQQTNQMTMSLSPDDRYLAYHFAPSPLEEPEIRVLAIDGSAETVIAPNPATDLNPLWTRDGSRVIFLSDRSGNADLWAVKVVDGRGDGEPELIRSRVGPIVPMSINDDGTLAYMSFSPGNNLQLITIPDSAGSTIAAQPLTDRFLGTNVRPTWSPDGSRVAYLSIRSGSGLNAQSDSFADFQNYLVVKSLDDGDETDIELPMPSVLRWEARPAWSEDGRRILFNAGDIVETETGITGRRAGFSVDLASGEVRLEPYLWDYAGFWNSGEGDLFVSGRQQNRLRELGIRIIGQRHAQVFPPQGTEPLRPDEKLLLMRGPGIGWLTILDCDPDDPPIWESGLVSRCLADGRFLQLVDRQPDPEIQAWTPNPWELSPDGNQVAYVRRNSEDFAYNVWVRSVAMDSEPVLVDTHSFQEGERIWLVHWTPDGRHLIYGFGETGADGSAKALHSVYKLDVERGEPELLNWNPTGDQLGSATFDPDARRAVIPVDDAESIGVGQEVWMLQGFTWDED